MFGRELPVPPPGAPSPFGLADPDDVRALLGRAGYDEVRLTDVRVLMWFGDDVDEAMAFLGASGPVRGLLEGLDPEQQVEGRRRLRDAFAGAAGPDGVAFASASWLVEARRPLG